MPAIVETSRALGLTESVVLLGTFDGVHLGHQALLARARRHARPGVPVVAYTFDPHPAEVLAKARAPKILLSTPERTRLLGEHGADVVVVERFDRAFSELEADRWFSEYLVAPLRPAVIVAGFNFTYGRSRLGDAGRLRASAEALGISADVVGPIELDGAVVSSSRIRELLAAGEVAAAARLLGRPYTLRGPVVRGAARGRTIGVPTANLAPDVPVAARPGVYATVSVLPDGRRCAGVTNIGSRPTFDGRSLSVETHLFDLDEDLYDAELRVELHAHLRDERRFSSPAELVAQIRRDVDEAMELALA